MSSHAHIATGLAKIGTFLRSERWRQVDGLGLTPTQAQILAQLVARGPARVSAVAEEIAVTQPTASDAIAALVRKGHLEKRADPADARAAQLYPTEAGRRAAEELAVWPDALLAAVDALGPAEQGVFLKGLSKMIRALQLRGAIPVQRMCVTCCFFRPNVYADPTAPHHCAFVDAAFGDAALRLDCGDHEAAPETQAAAARRRFILAAGAERAEASPAATDEVSLCPTRYRRHLTMTQKAIFYHAGCSVCVDAERKITDIIDRDRIDLEIVHLGESPQRIGEARAAGVKSVPALVMEGAALHINHGADLSALG